MNAELIFELAWKSALFAGATLAMLHLFRRRSSAERSWIANIGLAALILLPLMLLAGPQWQVQPPAPVAPLIPNLDAAAPILAPARPPADAMASAAPNAASWPAPAEALVWTYAIPAGLLVLLLLVSVLRLYLLRGRAEVLVEPRWSTALSAAQRRMRFKHGTALLVSRELRSPISWGVVRPIILLDPKAASDASQAEAIIAHELAHVARLDWAMLIVGRLATALYWFNPLVWMVARRAHELSEQAVDDSVLNADIPSADYAELLINAACHDNRAVILAANGVTGCGPLTRRVERVLDSSVSRSAARGGWVLGCVAALIGLAAPVAALSSRSANRVQVAPAAQPSSGLEQALVDAVDKGDVHAVNELLAQGVSVNAAVDGDGSPLIVAARNGRRDLVDLLLARGADIDMGVDGDGNPLIAAAAAGHAEIAQHLLDRGADIEAVVPSDENALMQASRHGHEAVVRLLIARGANVNSRVGVRTPLIMARMGRHSDIDALLRRAGATQ